MELPQAGHYCPIDNRSGVYRMLRNNKGHTVDAPVFRRGVGAYTNTDVIYRQRGSNQDDENTGVSSPDTSHRTQAPLHTRISGSKITYYQWDPREGESSGSLDKTVTYDSSEELEEGEFQRLIDEWLQ